MSKPDAATIQILHWIKTEIGAGMVLVPKTDADFAHNNACERANAIIGNYAQGNGLFQLTRHLGRNKPKTEKGEKS